jgi:phosphoserine phosphatase RsbX
MKSAVHWLSVPKAGETENGDVVVIRNEGDRTMLVLVDALGHGPHAAQIAGAAAAHATSATFPRDALEMIVGLHERLHGTRGAAGLVCILSAGRLEGCSVGNVDMRCQHGRIPVTLTPGILGARLKAPRVFGGELRVIDRIVIFSDGISSRFSLQDLRSLSPADACGAILKRCRRIHDDATVLVADIGSPQ